MAKFTVFARPDHDIMSIFIYPVEGETVDAAKADAQNQIEEQWGLQPPEYEIIGVLGGHCDVVEWDDSE